MLFGCPVLGKMLLKKMLLKVSYLFIIFNWELCTCLVVLSMPLSIQTTELEFSVEA